MRSLGVKSRMGRILWAYEKIAQKKERMDWRGIFASWLIESGICVSDHDMGFLLSGSHMATRTYDIVKAFAYYRE